MAAPPRLRRTAGGRSAGGLGTGEADALGDGANGANMEREQVLERYRRLREIAIKLNTEMIGRVPRPAMFDCAKRLGLLQGRNLLVAESEDELSLVFDLAIYTARLGRSRVVDRFRRTAPFEPGSDEALVLDAMVRGRMSLFMVKQRHEVAGLVLEDLLLREEVWLVDEGLEWSAPEGLGLAARVIKPETFLMTSGVTFPVSREDVEEVLEICPVRSGRSIEELAEGSQNARLTEALYRVAVRRSLLERVRRE